MSKNDHHLDFEEDFFSRDRKVSKKQRKELSAKDRSKYKKTDQKQLQKQAEPLLSKDLLSGRVLSISPEGITVEHDHIQYLCSLKGSLKKEKTSQKNLIVVGDFVLFDPTASVIISVQKRRSLLSRADNLRKNKEQLIAANIDQLFIVTSVIMPKLKPSLIDRYIIAAKQGNMTPIIVVNKIDLLTHPPQDLHEAAFKEAITLYKEFIRIYKALDIPIIEVSALTQQGLDELKAYLKHKASVFSGQSGVGKTTLLNKILGTTLRTADVVTRTYKGAHTTTTAQLLPLECDGFCIDTPGIKSFGIWQLSVQDLQHYFSEFQSFSPYCKYPNCKHLQEPDCAIKKAVEDGIISSMRYQSYHDLMTLPQDDLR